MADNSLILNSQPLSIYEVAQVARKGKKVTLGDAARTAVDKAQQVVSQFANKEEPTYGLNTGFGSLSRVRIKPDEILQVQQVFTACRRNERPQSVAQER